MAKKVLIINGSYRDNGVTDRAVEAIMTALNNSGANTEQIFLRNQKIDFCLNCRECMQEPGTDPKPCVQRDAMESIVQKIEEADAFVLAAPTNLGSVTAIFKQFMERLAVYAYWPWGAPSPSYRKDKEPRKKALLVSSSAAPGFVARLFFSSVRQLKYAARIMGAEPIGTLYTGMISTEPHPALPTNIIKKAERLAQKLF